MAHRTMVDAKFCKEVGQALVLSLLISGIWPLAALAEQIDLASPPPEQTHAAPPPQLKAPPTSITAHSTPLGDLDLALNATSISVLPPSKLQRDLTFPSPSTPDPHPASNPSTPSLPRPPRTLDEAGWTPTVQTVTEAPAPPVPDAVVPIDAPPSPPAQTSNPSTPTADLRISPRIGVGANSPSSGTETTTRLETFLPLWQQPGQSLSFLEGRLLIDDRGNPGGNVLIGYRQYSETLNRTFGGHLGFDIRNTDNHTFQQLGLGFESLGDDVDLYLNGFWPIGTTQQQTGQLITDTGLQLNGDPRFAGHALLLDLQRQRQITRQFEEALPGVDFELGKQLLRFENGGDLQAFLGAYFLHSGIRGNTVGARLRLQMQPTRNISAGVGIQHDDFFGTHVLGNITFTWPGNRPKGPIPSEKSVVARMGSSVNRTNNVIVDTPTTTEVLEAENRTVAALNPVTGQPWFFTHVNLGLGNSDGTFESPFGTVAEALAATQGNGNDIVYVAQGTNPGIPAFTVPDNVQVRSQGPTQRIEVSPIASQLSTPSTLNLGMVQLPASGNGQFPTVTGTVTMRNNTLLSGFAINPNGGNGVEAVGVQNVAVQDNQIVVSGDDASGIRLQNVSGSAEIVNNQIATSGNTTNTTPSSADFLTDGAHGIEIDLEDVTLTSAMIAGNSITTSGTDANGILVIVRSETGATELSTATISGNTISTVGDGSEGIQLTVPIRGSFSNATITGGTIGSVTVSGNDISTQGEFTDAIDVTSLINSTSGSGITDSIVTGGSIESVTVTGNTLSTQGVNAYGINVSTSTSGSFSNTVLTGSSLGSAMISDNTITTQGDRGNTIPTQRVGAHGINVSTSTSGSFSNTVSTSGNIDSTVISGNTITTEGDDARGINLGLSNSSMVSAAISGNTISTQGNDAAKGIYVSILGSSLGSATISGNTISNQGRYADGIGMLVFSTFSQSSLGSTTISGNTISTEGDEARGINLRLSSSLGSTTISDNTIFTKGDRATGIRTRLRNGSLDSATTISGNTITTEGNAADGIDVSLSNLVGGSSLDSAMLSDNNITIQGDAAKGINLNLYGGNLDSATISGNTITTEGNSTDGIGVDVSSGSSLDSATISDNNITTQGNFSADGIDMSLSNGSLGSAIILGNTITTEGNAARGINVFLSNLVGGSSLDSAMISDNTITTQGVVAKGINLSLYGGSLGSATISGNTITTEGNDADGIGVFMGGVYMGPDSSSDSATISDNIISTRGDSSDGIDVTLSYGSLGSATISGNNLSTEGDSANGIKVRFYYGSLGSATISGNTINTEGDSAYGIKVSMDLEGSLGNATISGNTISTQGDSARGINVDVSFNSSLDSATILGNTITTQGDSADGIGVTLSALFGESRLDNATISGNTISTEGEFANGIYVGLSALFGESSLDSATILGNTILQAGQDSVRIDNNGDNPICTSISANLSSNPNFAAAGGNDFTLISNGNLFQVVDLSDVSTNNNNATFSFDGTLVPPGTPLAPFTNVASCP